MSTKQLVLPLPVFLNAVDGKLKRKEIQGNRVNVRIPKYENMTVGDWVTVPAEVEPKPPIDLPTMPPEMFQVTTVADMDVSVRPPWESRYWTKIEVHYYVTNASGSQAVSQRVKVEVIDN